MACQWGARIGIAKIEATRSTGIIISTDKKKKEGGKEEA
jgi:hypothetical protein